MTIEWIRELCPEIAEWQAELIAEHVEQRVQAEREACAKVCDWWNVGHCAAAIRARGDA